MMRTSFLTGINKLNLLTSYGSTVVLAGLVNCRPHLQQGHHTEYRNVLNRFLMPPKTEVPLFFLDKV